MKRRTLPPTLLTIPETALHLRTSRRRVEGWVAAGVLQVVQWDEDSPRLVPLASIDRLISERAGAAS